jgi:hypothetical protein
MGLTNCPNQPQILVVLISASQLARITDVSYHTQLCFVFEKGSCCVAQSGLRLMGSSDPPQPAK